MTGMKTLATAALGLCLVGFAGAVKADEDTTKKLIGTWVIEKGSDLPEGSTTEFTPDGKLIVVIKDGGDGLKLEGTFKATKDTITVTLKVDQQTLEETVTIKKLTDEALVVEDKDRKVDTFRKKK